MSQSRAHTPTGGDFKPHNADDLFQQNVAVMPAYEHTGYDGRRQSVPGRESYFTSPGPQNGGNVYSYNSQQNTYPYQPNYATSGPEARYGTYSPQPLNHMYDDHQPFPSQFCTPVGSPVTTPSSTHFSGALTWAGPEANTGNQSQNQVPQEYIRNPRYVKTKNKKKRKSAADSVPKIAPLVKPLSELTKDWDHVPIVDIEAYVNRSAEERRREVAEGKIPGKVKRPMNSFMLYRKAYQNRTKKWCLQANHQVVSQVCGDSWPLESKEVREQYIEWSRIERLNHQNAHPGYKFSPSKAGASKTAKRKASETHQSDESDLEEYDWQGTNKRPKKQSKTTPRQYERNPALGSPYENYSDISEDVSYNGASMSPFPGNSPGVMPLHSFSPSPLGDAHRFAQSAHPSYFNPGVSEDGTYRQPNVPVMNHRGHPRSNHYSILDTYLPDDFTTPDHKIDPSLGAQASETYGTGYAESQQGYQELEVPNNAAWNTPYNLPKQEMYEEQQAFVGDQLHLHEQQSQILNGGRGDWSVEPLDVGQDFKEWMDEDSLGRRAIIKRGGGNHSSTVFNISITTLDLQPDVRRFGEQACKDPDPRRKASENDNKIRSVTAEVRDLDKDVSNILQPFNGSFDPSADPATACSLLVNHLGMRRNKRCLLVYHRTRTDKVEKWVWSGVDVLGATGPFELGLGGGGTGGAEGNADGATSSLSPEEEEYVRQYSDLLAAYKGQWTDIDLTGSLEPPRDLFIDVRVLKDAGEIQTEYGAITLSKNSQFYVRQGDVERLIAQGYLQKLS